MKNGDDQSFAKKLFLRSHKKIKKKKPLIMFTENDKVNEEKN